MARMGARLRRFDSIDGSLARGLDWATPRRIAPGARHSPTERFGRSSGAGRCAGNNGVTSPHEQTYADRVFWLTVSSLCRAFQISASPHEDRTVPVIREDRNVPGIREDRNVPGIREDRNVPGIREDRNVPGIR
ncbi:hypothetical protein LSAT2_006673, partial [Lamellibrachia satsuma]